MGTQFIVADNGGSAAMEPTMANDNVFDIVIPNYFDHGFFYYQLILYYRVELLGFIGEKLIDFCEGKNPHKIRTRRIRP